jgi:hypothetical protein
MNNFYNLIDTIKSTVEASPFNNKVTFGDITDIDTNKLTAFPLSHIIVDGVDINDRTLDFTVTVVCMDIVDVNKNEGFDDDFYGNDNVQDILNTQLSVMTTLIGLLKRLDLNNTNFLRVTQAVNATPFLDRFENELAGWEASMVISTVNDSSIC